MSEAIRVKLRDGVTARENSSGGWRLYGADGEPAAWVRKGDFATLFEPAQPTPAPQPGPCAWCLHDKTCHNGGIAGCILPGCGCAEYLDPATVPPRPSRGPDGKRWNESKWILLPPVTWPDYQPQKEFAWHEEKWRTLFAADDYGNGLRWRARRKAVEPKRDPATQRELDAIDAATPGWVKPPAPTMEQAVLALCERELGRGTPISHVGILTRYLAAKEARK